MSAGSRRRFEPVTPSTTRRDVLKLAATSALGAALPLRLIRAALDPRAQVSPTAGKPGLPSDLPFTPIPATTLDDLVLAPEFTHKLDLLAATGDDLGEQIGLFGDGCDHTAFLSIDRLKHAPDPTAPHRGFATAAMSSREGLLVVNHEGLEVKLFHADWKRGEPKTHAQIVKEQQALGLSVIHVTIGVDGRWHVRNV